MERRRIGNDIKIRWAVFGQDDQQPVDFTGKSVKVEIRHSQLYRLKYPQQYEISGNIIEMWFTAKEQESAGVYNLWLEYTYPDDTVEGGIATVTLDNCKAFELVLKSCELAVSDADIIYLEGFVSYGLTENDKKELAKLMLDDPSLNILTPYDVAVENGFIGTEEEWLESLHGKDGKDFTFDDFTEEQIELLQKPATDAAGLAAAAATLAGEKALLAEQKAGLADAAAQSANQAASGATAATQAAEMATQNAITAKEDAETATSAANQAAENATGAASLAGQAAEAADEAKESANEAAENANSVAGTTAAAEAGRQAKYEGLELVTANALLEDAGKIQSLVEFIINSVYERITVGLLNVADLRIQGAEIVLTGVAAPSAIPEFIGQVYINTVGKVAYTATGIDSVSDWKQQ